MLLSLAIRDIVLIHRLDLALEKGLCVLTGETGAGKSILLDSLGLALGARADSGLVRLGTDQGSVTAEFELALTHPVFQILKDQDLECEDGVLILRRVVTSDGRSRAYVNDQPISVSLLNSLGKQLVEIHGQHDDRGLLNPQGHRTLLDAHANNLSERKEVERSCESFQDAKQAYNQEVIRLSEARDEEDFDRHAFEELQKISPQIGEEEKLAEDRSFMMQGEKSAETIKDILNRLNSKAGIESALRGALRKLERTESPLREHLEGVIELFSRAAFDLSEGMILLDKVQKSLDFHPNQLDEIEERLFALRALGRKHKVQVDHLPVLMADLENRLAALNQGEKHLLELEGNVTRTKEVFFSAIGQLSSTRKIAAQELDRLVADELPPLKLESARFLTKIIPLPEENWSPEGAERAEFEVSTNPGSPFGPMIKIASGGELARFILALKVVLAKGGSAPTIVFDEVDRGIGGATASAVGERLARLSDEAQVLVVTHSPQVAAKGQSHWRITKFEIKDANPPHSETKIVSLNEDERQEEIARMLSGSKVTDEARAAAGSLMTGTG